MPPGGYLEQFIFRSHLSFYLFVMFAVLFRSLLSFVESVSTSQFIL